MSNSGHRISDVTNLKPRGLY